MGDSIRLLVTDCDNSVNPICLELCRSGGWTCVRRLRQEGLGMQKVEVQVRAGPTAPRGPSASVRLPLGAVRGL
jgi:hypothetical protein